MDAPRSKQDKYSQLKRKQAAEHAAIILKDKCELKQHQYYLDKEIDDLFLVLKEDYKIHYQEFNPEIGRVENKSQTIKAGAVILPIYHMRTEELIGAQFIYSKLSGKQNKFYIVGTPKSEGIHIIEGGDKYPWIGVVEGHANGVIVSKVTGATVVVTFDSNEMKNKASQLKNIFNDQQLIFFGDNDNHKESSGNKAAHTAAIETNGQAILPLHAGEDWADFYKKYGANCTKKEIERQMDEYGKQININDRVIGVSITSSVRLANGDAVSYGDALVLHPGTYCVFPPPDGKAIINAGTIHSFFVNKTIFPTLINLYDQALIDECQKISGMKRRLKWLSINKTQKHMLAFVHCISYRIGVDIPNHELFSQWVCSKVKFSPAPEILMFIECIARSKMNLVRNVVRLNPLVFKNQLQLKQENGRLNWSPAIDAALSGKYKLIAIKAQHGQGKTEEFIKRISQHINKVDKPVYVAHRAKLITQAAATLDYYHYEDEREIIRQYGSPNLACCLHSFKHEIYLNFLQNADNIFIDEASQVLKALYTDEHIHPTLPEKFSWAIKGACIYILDADLTEQEIMFYQQLSGVKDDEILIITAEAPKRDFNITISTSTALRHYKTPIINAIKKDLDNDRPCVLAVESETTARGIYFKLKKDFPQKRIVLFTGKTPAVEARLFIDNINENMADVDLLIHTSVIGSGVSIQHHNKRFTKGYGLFYGMNLSATECIQMLRRCRDIHEWEIGLLCRPTEIYMINFHKNLGEIALKNLDIQQNSICEAIQFNLIKHKSYFIPILRWLLINEYAFNVIDKTPSIEIIEDLMSETDIRELDIKELMTAIPLSLNEAFIARKKGYQDQIEMLRSEAALCIDHYKITHVTQAAGELWCKPAKREAARRMERIIQIINQDKSVIDVQKKIDILNKSGITINLFTSKKLAQSDIKILRDCIAEQCANLSGLKLLPERYAMASKIPSERPIAFLSWFLKSIGFDVQTKQSRNGNREYQLDISIPPPLASRLNLDVRSEKQRLKDRALELKKQGLSYAAIANALNLDSKSHARQLTQCAECT